ncbi:MAG: SNARE associated Golgi protein [Rhodospirillaceae bacterium]|nr:SNARE associated Golgi protein [Rhodospirillaceae bacterium]
MSPLIKTILRGICLIILLSVLGFSVQSGGLGGVFNQDWVDDNVRGAGIKGNLIFVFGAGLVIALGLPRQIISFLGGYAFGLLLGTGLALVATSLGCVISFTFARFMGRELVSARFPTRLKKANGFLRYNSFAMALLIRLLPLGSNLVTNLVAGVSSASALGFLAGSVLGYIPQTIIFALLGSGINLDPAFRITSSVLLFVLSAALGVYLYRRYRQGQELNGGLE